MSKIIEIGWERTCSCEDNKLNCMIAKEWIQYESAVWQFKYEALRDVRKKEDHPAAFPLQLPKKMILLFTHEGELVLEPFLGSGTTLVAASDTNRNAIGFDLQQKYIDLAEKRIKKNVGLFDTAKQICVNDDANNINQYITPGTVKLVVTSPPYADVLNKPRLNKGYREGNKRANYKAVEQYSDLPNDLGTMRPNDFIEVLGNIFHGIRPLMRDDGHIIINIADVWDKETNRKCFLGLMTIDMMGKIGYELKDILIWDKTNFMHSLGIVGWPKTYVAVATYEWMFHFIPKIEKGEQIDAG